MTSCGDPGAGRQREADHRLPPKGLRGNRIIRGQSDDSLASSIEEDIATDEQRSGALSDEICEGLIDLGFVTLGRRRRKGGPSSRTGETRRTGKIGGSRKSAASFEARSAPRSYPATPDIDDLCGHPLQGPRLRNVVGFHSRPEGMPCEDAYSIRCLAVRLSGSSSSGLRSHFLRSAAAAGLEQQVIARTKTQRGSCMRELVSAFIAGRVDRRRFLKGMTASGFTSAAAKSV